MDSYSTLRVKEKRSRKRRLNPKIALALIIAISVAVFILYRDFGRGETVEIVFDRRAVIGIVLSLLLLGTQCLAMSQRFVLLSRSKLNLQQGLHTTLMAEFASAITPSSVGGSGLMPIFLHRQGLSIGRATCVSLSGLFLDELFFCISCAILLLVCPLTDLFTGSSILNQSVRIGFSVLYLGIILWTSILFVALFLRPDLVKDFILWTFNRRILKRWKSSAQKMANDLEESSKRLSCYPFGFWLRGLILTAIAWCSRYGIAVALLYGFAGDGSWLLAFARQFVIWIVLMLSPSPGAAGFSEYMFSHYYADFFANGASNILALALVWRILTYYSFLFIGLGLVPKSTVSTN